MAKKKLIQIQKKIRSIKMTIPDLQIGAFGCRFAIFFASRSTLAKYSNFLVNLHRISISDVMARSNLALDAPDNSDTPDSGCGAEAR